MSKSRGQLHIWGLRRVSCGLAGFRDAKGEGDDKSDSAGLLVGLAILGSNVSQTCRGK